MLNFEEKGTSDLDKKYVSELSKMSSFTYKRLADHDMGGGRHKVPGFNLGALNCCLTLKFGVCIESYVHLAKIKKNWKNFQN